MKGEQTPSSTPITETNADDSSVKFKAVGASINFICNDALAVYRDITSRGITARRPFVGNAM